MPEKIKRLGYALKSRSSPAWKALSSTRMIWSRAVSFPTNPLLPTPTHQTRRRKLCQPYRNAVRNTFGCAIRTKTAPVRGSFLIIISVARTGGQAASKRLLLLRKSIATPARRAGQAWWGQRLSEVIKWIDWSRWRLLSSRAFTLSYQSYSEFVANKATDRGCVCVAAAVVVSETTNE